MLFRAWTLALLGGAVLTVLVATAKTTRGENLMGFHLVTAPIALALTLALALGVAGGWPGGPMQAWLLFAALPGWCVGLTMLPYTCFGHRGAGVGRLLVLLALAALFLVLGGPRLGGSAQLVGGVLVIGYSAVTTAVVAWWWLGPRWRRLALRRRPQTPDSFAVSQGAFERERFARLPADAGLDALLGFSRALDDNVRADCHARLAMLPDLVPALLARIESEEPSDALHFLAYQDPGARADLAAPFGVVLDRAREAWSVRLNRSRQPAREISPALRLLDCGIAILRDGGDVREPLQRWHSLIAAHPPLQDRARELRKFLRAARWRSALRRFASRG